MNWWRFFAWNAAGGICWAILVGLVAYYAGHAAATAIGHYGLYGGAAVVVAALLGLADCTSGERRCSARRLGRETECRGRIAARAAAAAARRRLGAPRRGAALRPRDRDRAREQGAAGGARQPGRAVLQLAGRTLRGAVGLPRRHSPEPAELRRAGLRLDAGNPDRLPHVVVSARNLADSLEQANSPGRATRKTCREPASPAPPRAGMRRSTCRFSTSATSWPARRAGVTSCR